MDLTPYLSDFSQRFEAAAEASGPEARTVAGRLSSVLDSAIRLLLLSVLSAATVEISRDLAPGSVEIRLRGLDPDFVVTPPPADAEYAEPPLSDPGTVAGGARPAPAIGEPDSDEGGTWRINLRLPAHLSPRIEAAASRENLSVNAWLVRAASTALEPGDRDRDSRSGRRGGTGGTGGSSGYGAFGGQRYTGWVR